MDEIDRKIVELLQRNARIPNAEIARRVNMAPSAILERVKKLEERQIIRDYRARIDPKAVGLGLLAFISVQGEQCNERLGDSLTRIPGVLEVHSVAGEDCYLTKIRARDTEHLGRILEEYFWGIPGIRATRTTIVLTTLQETGVLPVSDAGESE